VQRRAEIGVGDVNLGADADEPTQRFNTCIEHTRMHRRPTRFVAHIQPLDAANFDQLCKHIDVAAHSRHMTWRPASACAQRRNIDIALQQQFEHIDTEASGVAQLFANIIERRTALDKSDDNVDIAKINCHIQRGSASPVAHSRISAASEQQKDHFKMLIAHSDVNWRLVIFVGIVDSRAGRRAASAPAPNGDASRPK
jgi:hypothetical protein